MQNIKITTFMEEGTKKVLSIIVAPQKFLTIGMATVALGQAVAKYQQDCGRPYITTYDPGNPFVVYIIHGINE
jgi:hypothetical protein